MLPLEQSPLSAIANIEIASVHYRLLVGYGKFALPGDKTKDGKLCFVPLYDRLLAGISNSNHRDPCQEKTACR